MRLRPLALLAGQSDTAENDKVTLVIPPDSQSCREHLMSSSAVRRRPRGCVPNEKSNSWMPVVVNKKGVLPSKEVTELETNLRSTTY